MKAGERITFLDFAERVLAQSNVPLSPVEIWAVGTAKNLTGLLQSKGKTPIQSLKTRLLDSARDEKSSKFVSVGSRPVKYKLKDAKHTGKATVSVTEVEKAVDAISPVSKARLKERDLHQFLAYFAFNQFESYTKTINHLTSSRSAFGEWVHPDMIGVSFPFKLDRNVLELSKMIGGLTAKFYSFEIKLRLSFSNLRESFFQAVSNSSWAHEGYLVTSNLDSDEEFLSELRRLSNSFGIGVIEIDVEDPDSSKIMMPSHERDNLDWDALDKLTMNADAKALLARIRNDLSTHEVRSEFYDAIKSATELQELARVI